MTETPERHDAPPTPKKPPYLAIAVAIALFALLIVAGMLK